MTPQRYNRYNTLHRKAHAVLWGVCMMVQCLAVPPVFADPPGGGGSAYSEARDDGWFWYKDKERAAPAPKKTPQPQTQPPVAGGAPAKAEPFTASWVREKLPILLDRALTNPTPENVRAYKYMERLAVDMASNFANMSQKVVASDPMLDESVRFPISAMARQSALWQVDRAREAIMHDLSRKAGIWMFFDSKCHFCQSQYQILKMLSDKYRIEVRYISTDGGVFQGMRRKQVLFDRGGARAREMGIQLTPAVVMVVPPDRLAIVAHGAMPLSELEQKMVTAAIDMKLADPSLTDTATLQARGILSHQDMMQAKTHMNNPDDPDELVKMLNNLIRSKM